MPDSHLNSLLAEADRCVKCGLCLPECPTYQLYGDENESPRGRIALAEAVLKNKINITTQLQAHFDHCLLCRRCERICPSQVHYSPLVDAVRNQYASPKWQTRLSQQPKITNYLYKAARLLPDLSDSIKLSKALPQTISAPKSGIYPANQPQVGRVGLFLGCVSQSLQPNALHASIKVLTALGFDVVVSKTQTCCGALNAHNGQLTQAHKSVKINQQAFNNDLDAIISLASGCTTQLSEQSPSLLAPAKDISQFLSEMADWSRLRLKPLAALAALHHPCSLENVLRASDAVETVLARIPQLKIQSLGKRGKCCGAAGEHILTQRQQAKTLRAPLLDELTQINPNYLLTSNVGCALHLAEGANAIGCSVETRHPIELLAQQL